MLKSTGISSVGASCSQFGKKYNNYKIYNSMKFKQWFFESSQSDKINHLKAFLQSAIDNFPSENDLLIMADYLQENGDELGNIIRIMIQEIKPQLLNAKDKKTSALIEQRLNQIIERGKNRLKKMGIITYTQTPSIKVIETRNGERVEGDEYKWHGNLLTRSSRNGSSSRTFIQLDSINKISIIKGLAFLVSLFFMKSIKTTYGLENYRNSKRNLTKEGQALIRNDQELRYAIRDFLIYLRSLEELVQRFNRTTRRSRSDIREVEHLISYRGYGYLWQIPVTTHVISNFIQRNGVTPFLLELRRRLYRTLNLIPHFIETDQRMVDDLMKIVDIIRRD